MEKKAMAFDLSPDLTLLMEAAFHRENAELVVCRDTLEWQRAFFAGWYCLFIVNISAWTVSTQKTSVEKLRSITYTPLLVLTSAESAADLLEAGADMCLPTETPMDSIVSHALSLIRRYTLYNHYDLTSPDAAVLYRGALTIDPLRHRVTLAGETVRLQRREFRLLTYFAQNPGIVLTPEQICDKAWMTECNYNRDVSPIIAELRRKLGDDRESPAYIETVHGVGYRFLPHK